MSILTDFIFQFQQRILNRYTNKTLPLSIKKEDHANSFNEISNALLIINPQGLKNQIQFVNGDNLNEYNTGDQVEIGQFITNDTELTSAQSRGSASQEDIFSKFKRYSHGGSPTNPTGVESNNTVPGQPLQTNSWAYDTGTNQVTSTFNSGSAIGLVSIDKFDSYIHTLTIGSDDTLDNDVIGIVIAFVEDPDDLVPNHAFGLDPADFNWPINVTDALIPNQHSLILLRSRNGGLDNAIVYDYQKLTQKVIYNGRGIGGLYETNNFWNGNTADLSAVRVGDDITTMTSQLSDAPGGKGDLGFAHTFSLNSDPVLLKFRGKQSYGYMSQSQAGSFYSDINFSGSNNVIYDLRNGDVYVFGSSGYTLDPSRDFFNEIGVRRILYNPYEFKLLYVAVDLTIYTLASRSSNILPSDINKRLPFQDQSSVAIDWQNDIAPESTLTYAELFGNNPMFTIQINNGDNTYSGLKEFGETRTKDVDQLSLLSVTFNLGPFTQTGEIIIE